MKRILGIMVLTVMFCLNLTADLNDGLVAHYPFNGNANDESGNENHGTVHGAILCEDRFTNLNSAYEFDGINNFINLHDTDLEGSFTLSVWHNAYVNTPIYQGILTKKDISVPVNTHYGLQLHEDDVWGQVSNGTQPHNWIPANDTVVLNSWQHLIFINTPTTAKIYIDGELITDVANSYSQAGNSVPWKIGVDGSYGNFYQGCIDDIRLYNRALTEEEIQELYYWFKATFTSPQTAYIGEPIPFIDTSAANPTTWEWDFENDGIYDLTYNSHQDTIYWTYENTDVDSVKLRISRDSFVDSLTKKITVLYCPPTSPDSVQLTLNFPDVTISWTAVDTTICGSLITPDLYVVQYSETAEDSLFYYLSYVLHPITSFNHIGVLQYGNNGEPSDHMFYKVIAIKNYSREQIEYLESLNNSREKVKWSEVKQNLNEIRK